MRIGLFTDSYTNSGSTNGVIYMVEMMRQGLEDLGHDVYVVAPKTGMARPKFAGNVLWIPALQGIFFNEQLTSIFFPPTQLRSIAQLELDVIVMFTPGQIGLLGAHSALQQDIPLVSQYCTDLSEYAERYPAAMVGVVALAMASPFALKLTSREMATVLRSLVAKEPDIGFRQHVIEKMLAALHNRCSAIIAVSQKTAHDLARWNPRASIVTIPTAVESLPASVSDAKAFRRQHGIPKNAEVLLYVGRLAKEKNLDLLIDAFNDVASARTDAFLVFVGDFAYRKQLEQHAEKSNFADRIIFTGAYPREDLGSVYAAGDVFLFPSVTDTQALVVNEAAHAGLPLVWVDDDLNDVLVDGVTGLQSPDNPEDFAFKILELLQDSKKRTKFAAQSKQRASRLTRTSQAQKVAQLLESLM